MSKSTTRTAIKTNSKNEAQRKTTKSPATSVAAATATTTTSRRSKDTVKQQDSVESEKSLRKTTRIATVSTTTGKKPSSLHTSKNKEREPGSSKRTTPSPTTKATSTLRAAKQQQPVSKAKPNAVLDTYHSVTVSSPPPKGRVQPKQKPTATGDQDTIEDTHQPRARTYSRTLQPEEILVLKGDSAKQRSQLEVQKPMAFEVNFNTVTTKQPQPATQESDNYSDDFESYESDFETDASTPEEDENDEEQDEQEEQEEQNKQEKQNESEESKEQEEYNKQQTDELKAISPTVDESNDEVDNEEDSEPTQNPITVIQRDKELERKLDSGHYDMNSRRLPQSTSTQQQDDSFDTNSVANSDQLDSGISSYGVPALVEHPRSQHSISDVYYGGYVDFVAHPIYSRRGVELMRKLRFDQLNYQLFEMKPLSYEGYMQSYGKLNTCQLAIQTQSQHMDNECQTLEVHTRTSWTQHPPHYGGQLVLSCSGDGGDDFILRQRNNDDLEYSLARLEQLRLVEQQRALQQQRLRLTKPTDLERLGVFLHKASLLMGKVLNGKSALQSPRQVSMLQTGFLNALQVRRIFGSSGQQQLVVTVHECLPNHNVYSDDFANLLMVWSLTDPSKPLRLLSTWAEVCRVTFSIEAPDVIVAGLRDGSIAMWDLRETYSYCSKLDGNLTHFAATQSVVPCVDSQSNGLTALDLGAVVDVRSFRPAPKSAGLVVSSLALVHNDIQYASLNDSGLLTIWTLVESGRGCDSSTNEYSSPWARVKLLQAATCNLRLYLEQCCLKRNQSAYDKTKSLFQGNVYSDELLRELNETQMPELSGEGLQGLRFSSIDTGTDLIYVCLNRNFVLSCTRSLKTERFTRIGLHESRFLFPTSLCVLANENFIAVGLSNGSVMILNCNHRQRQRMPPRPITAIPDANLAADPETGKSCAIQNIILNERRSFEQLQLESSSSSYEPRPNTALELLHQPRRSYERRVFDQQLLLSGNALRQHLVQALVQSNDGWHLFALADGSVRIYDFHLDRERSDIGQEIGSTISDIGTASCFSNEQKLLVLGANEQIQMHSLNL